MPVEFPVKRRGGNCEDRKKVRLDIQFFSRRKFKRDGFIVRLCFLSNS